MTRKPLALLALALVAVAASAWADDTKPAPPASKPAVTEAPPSTPPPSTTPISMPPPSTTPPPELQKLAALLGRWNAEQHMFAVGDSPESREKSTAEYQWVMGGMHLKGTHSFAFEGKPMSGQSVWSFDPVRSEYQCVWMDGMSPTCQVFTGNFTGDGKLVVRMSTMIQSKSISHIITYAFPTPDSYTMRYETDVTGAFKPMLEESGMRAKAGVNEATAKKPSVTAKKKG
jgi:hypothetical protein